MTDQTKAAPVVASKHAADVKVIDTNIKGIKAKGKAFHDLVDTTARAIVARSLSYGQGGHNDCSRVPHLLAALPNSSRVKALAAWFNDLTNVRVKRDDETGKWSASMVKADSKMYRDITAAQADAFARWDEHTNEREPVPAKFDDIAFSSALASLLKRADSASEGARIHLSPSNLQRLTQLRTMQNAAQALADQEAARLKAAKYLGVDPAKAMLPQSRSKKVTPIKAAPKASKQRDPLEIAS